MILSMRFNPPRSCSIMTVEIGPVGTLLIRSVSSFAALDYSVMHVVSVSYTHSNRRPMKTAIPTYPYIPSPSSLSHTHPTVFLVSSMLETLVSNN